jgi:hypothetical protein
MNNPVCAVCGHVNPVGAVACEACDARLYAAEGAGAADDFQGGHRPFDWSGGPSSTASESYGPGGAWAPADDGHSAPADDIPSPPFKGVEDVVSPMLAVYRKHFTLVGLLVLVAMVPEALLQFGLIGFMAGRSVLWEAGSGGVGGGSSLVALAAVSGVILWLLAIAAGSLLSGSLVYAIVDLQRTGSSSAAECLRRGLKVLPKVLLVTILYWLITGAGFVLLIVPGVILSLMLAVCVPALVVEGLGPIEALNRSNELTKGYKGLIFITYFLWGLLVFVLNIIISWSFANGGVGGLGILPTMILQRAVLGMISSTLHVLTVYIYLGLLREHRSGFRTKTFTA